jgi:hypothetical protein
MAVLSKMEASLCIKFNIPPTPRTLREDPPSSSVANLNDLSNIIPEMAPRIKVAYFSTLWKYWFSITTFMDRTTLKHLKKKKKMIIHLSKFFGKRKGTPNLH